MPPSLDLGLHPALRRGWLRTGLGALALTLTAATTTACLKVPPEDESETPGAPKIPDSAQGILDRYLTAIGGEAAVRAIHQRTVESRMVVKPEVGCDEDDDTCLTEEQTGTFLLQLTDDTKLYRRTVLGNAIEERGFDGKEGWQLQGGILVLDDAQGLAATREDAVLHWYFDFAARGITATPEPPRTEDHRGEPATFDGIRWEHADPEIPTKTMWFDRESGLLREELVEEPAGDGQNLRQWVLYDDYREVDGVQVAHTIRLLSELGDRAQEVAFTAQRVDHKPLDPELFAVPTLPAPAPTPDPLLEALAAARAAYEDNPKDPTDIIAYARAAWSAAHFDLATTLAKEALRLDAKESEALWILARAQVLQGEWRDATKTLDRAAKAGLRPELLAAQRAWIASHNRDFAGVADALDATGPANQAVASRYRSFAGKPLEIRNPVDGCTALIPLHQADTSLPLVDIEIAGVEVRAMIDTGATDVILDDELAARLKVPIRSRTPVSKTEEIGHGQIEALTVGDFTIRTVPVDVFSTATIAAMSGSDAKIARAVLGVRFLELFQVTVDHEAATLTLVDAQTKRCARALTAQRSGPSVPFWVHETHFIYVPAALNQAEGLFLLNTGMQGVDLAATTKAYRRAGIGAPPLRRGQPALVTVDHIHLGEYETRGRLGAYGYFEQSKSSDDFRIDGMLGLGALARGRWTLDFADRRLYLEAPAAGLGTKP